MPPEGDGPDCDTGETGGAEDTDSVGETAAACDGFDLSTSSPVLTAGDAADLRVSGATGTTSIRVFRGATPDGELARGDGPSVSATFAPTLADRYTLVAADTAGCTASVEVLVDPGPAASMYSEVGPQAYDEDSGELVRRATVLVLDAFGNPVPVDVGAFAIDPAPRGMDLDTSDSTDAALVLRASSLSGWVTGGVVVAYEAWSTSLDLGLVPQELRVGEPGGGPDLPGVEEGQSALLYPSLYVPAGVDPVVGWVTTFLVSGAAAENIYVSEPPSESAGCEWTWEVEATGRESAQVTVTATCEEPLAAGLHQPILVEVLGMTADRALELVEYGATLVTAAGEWIEGLLREIPVRVQAKATTDICLSFWYLGDTTGTNAAADLANAERILDANSKGCTCPRFYRLKPTMHALTAAEHLSLMDLIEPSAWFSDPEMEQIAAGHPLRDDACINVYYGRIYYPFTSGGISYETAAGLSYSGASTAPTSGAIFIDTTGGRGTTLAHELVHKGSGNTVLDSPKDNGQTPQGAKAAGNLFNYLNPGESLSATQCGLFDDNLP